MSTAILEGYGNLTVHDGSTDFLIVKPTPFAKNNTKVKRWWRKNYGEVTYEACAIIEISDVYIVVSCAPDVELKMIYNGSDTVTFDVGYENPGDGNVERILVVPKDDFHNPVNYDDYYYDYSIRRLRKNTYGTGVLIDVRFDNASLDLRFAQDKTLTDNVSKNNLITFSRASSGTYVDGDGLIKTTPVNLLTRSEDFDLSPWQKLNTSVTANVVASPDGTVTADKLVENTFNAEHLIKRSYSVTSGKTYTGSIYVKAAERTKVRFGFTTTKFSSPTRGEFDLTTGTAVEAYNTITDVGNGWYRLTVTNTAIASGTTILSLNLLSSSSSDSTYTGDGASGVHLWGAQLEEGSTATDYIPTTSTKCGAPRFDHDPATGESLGLLIEEARTNDVLNSVGVSLYSKIWLQEPTSVVGPDGSNNAKQFLSSSNGTHDSRVTFAAIPGTVIGTTYTATVYVKGVNYNTVSFGFGNQAFPGGTRRQFFLDTLTTGDKGSAAAISIEDAGNGWRRLRITSQPADSTNSRYLYLDLGSTGDNTHTTDQGFQVFGLQVEAGSFPTSFIPTSGSTVTRAADVAEITGADFAKTNLLQYSERFDLNTTVTNGSIIPNAVVAPDGSNTADLLTGSSPQFYKNRTTNNTKTYVVSVYVKAADDTTGELRIGLSGNYVEVQFDLSAETHTIVDAGTATAISGGIQSVGNGWYRVHVVGSAVGTSTSNIVYYGNLYWWGAQLEEGSVLTDYTPSAESFTSRASSATYVDDTTGLIKTTPVNLFLQSQTFNSASWITQGMNVATASVDSPFDTSTVYQMTANATPNYILQNNSNLKANQTYTQSIFAKAGSSNFIQVAPSSGFNSSHVNFQLTGEGTVGTNTTGGVASIEKVGNDGWYRVKLTIQRNSTDPTDRRILFAVAGSLTTSRLGASSGSVHIWGAQIEEGSTATPYIKTTSTISGAARYENGELILEKARTNIIDRNTTSYSSIWNNHVPTGAYNNAGIAPDGTNTAFATTSYGVSRGQKNYDITSDTKDYTFSIFIKSTGGQGVYESFRTGFHNGNQDTSGQVIYDFATDAVGHGYSRKLYANGWVRVWKTYTNTNRTIFLVSNNNDTSLDMLFWGAQLEQGSYPSSLIITPYNSDVTRAADVSNSALGVDSFYNQSEGTVFIETEETNLTNLVAVSISNGTDNNKIELRSSGADLTKARGFIKTSATTEFDKKPSASTGRFRSIAFGVKTNDTIVACDGNLSGLGTSVTLPSVSRLYLGNEFNNTDRRPGHIKRLSYFPTRLPDATLQNITS